MSQIREKLSNMFTKVMAGTVSREEGALFINHLVKEAREPTLRELEAMIETPPPGVFPKTILHTVAISRNKVFVDLLVTALEHENTELNELAAHELAMVHTDQARDALAAHLSSPDLHPRKYSAEALAEGFGAEGVEVLKEHVLGEPQEVYRKNSAEALVKGGRRGVEALAELLSAEDSGAAKVAAGVIRASADRLDDEAVAVVVDALREAGDRDDERAVVGLLTVVGAFNERASGFEGFVRVFADHSNESVREAARAALERIGA